MPREHSITLDQENPQVGDTITFTVEGANQKAEVTVNAFQEGLVFAERKPVGEPFTLTGWTGEAAVIAYVYANEKLLAMTSFYAGSGE